MVFWGLEVKPGKPQSYHPKNEQGKLHVTQATLGAGSGKGKSAIQCSIGDNKTPVYLCSLLPNKTECCPLNLEFDDNDEPVEFSVIGDTSIHLSGYLETYEEECDQDDDDDDLDGIDIGESESEESSDYDSDDDDDDMGEFDDFLDSNLDMFQDNVSVPNSGVVIEEIEDEEKPVEDDKTKRPKKKGQASKDEKVIVVKESADEPDLISEDEDGLPIRKGKEPENKASGKMDLTNDEQGSNKKRKANASEQVDEQESANKTKKKKNQKEKKKGVTEEGNEMVQAVNVLKKQETSQNSSNAKAQNGTVNTAISETAKTPDESAEKKNKKKKKKASEEAKAESKAISNSVEKPNQVNAKASQERTYPNGLVVEELQMGKPNGKRASPGNTVSVHYIGKLQKNGKIFDSNIGKAPFKFRLGVGQVIKGWDVGVNGMRVGDKRRLTIPPSMGYGARGAGGQIPPNAWLMFDVELINVR